MVVCNSFSKTTVEEVSSLAVVLSSNIISAFSVVKDFAVVVFRI